MAAKRIDAPAQVARALVSLPEVRDPSRLPNASAELLHRIAEARGSLMVQSIPMGLEPLAARGIVFARVRGDGPPSSQTGRATAATAIELVLPHAFLVQLRSWEGEDPRGIRALLGQAPFETVSAIASHYLGRPATPPIALSLEGAWEALSDSARLAEEIERLAPIERRLLEALEREGARSTPKSCSISSESPCGCAERRERHRLAEVSALRSSAEVCSSPSTPIAMWCRPKSG